MYTNRFFTLLVIMAIVLVATLTVRETIATSAIDLGAEARPYVMDSATRSYIAWGQAMQVRNAIDSGTRSYIAWGEALEKAKLNALDSGTRSYIAWGEALQAAGKLSDSGACANATQENIFAGIDNSLDSATRSYIAWGLALQAKNDIHGCH
jgi:hypothetical protein